MQPLDTLIVITYFLVIRNIDPVGMSFHFLLLEQSQTVKAVHVNKFHSASLQVA